jgi:PAS domain S-box-containing protein
VAPRDDVVRWSTRIVESAGDAIVGADLEGRITLWNAASERLLGYTAEEILGRPASLLEGSGPAASARVAAVIRGERATPHDTQWTTKHGTAVPVSVTISTVRDEQGAIVGTSRLVRDVGERVRAEEASRASEAELRTTFEPGAGGQARGDPVSLLEAIIDGSSDAIYVKDREGRYLLANAATARLAGTRAEDMVGKTDLAILPPAAAAEVMRRDETVMSTGKLVTFVETVPVQGTLRTFWSTKGVYRDAMGRIIGLFGISRDMTGGTAREEEVRRQGRLQEALFSQAITNFALFDREFRYIRVNEAYARHYHRQVSDFPGRTYFELFPYDNSPENARVVESIMREGKAFKADGRRYVFADLPGQPVAYFDMIMQPIVDELGDVEFLFFSSIDVTERVLAQERLRASLQEKEVMLREIHHRVKNNLQFISSLLSLQAAGIDDRRVAEALAESHSRVRAVAMVHDNLYRSQDLSSIPLATHLEALCAHLLRSYAVDVDRVALDLRVADVRLDLDRSIRCGLITNELVSNAIKHAFPDGRSGRITVRFIESPGTYELSVSDNGAGLSPAIDPEHTTSLGLQLVGDLAEHLSGALTVERAGGTTFTIRFPSLAQGAGV